jgi:3-hydroxyisobutyrate dehydrogenase-like beta-hydroxyacid dehydrogenase
MPETLGFIGLGNMGEPIARNLIAAGYGLRVYNRTPAKAAAPAAKGATVVTDPADVASAGGVVVTMLADDRAVEAVSLPAGSFVEKLGRGGLHISLSTIAPATSRRLTEHHTKFGVDYLSCPVFGRPQAAARKKLRVCMSGPAAARKRALPVAGAIGQQNFDFGDDPGAANVATLCGNFLIASTIEALAELLVLAQKNGVNIRSIAELVGSFSPLFSNYGNMIADQCFEPAGFRLLLGFKDIHLILQTARDSTTPLPLASLLYDRWLSSIAKGRGELDWSAVALDVAEDAGLEKKVVSA